MAGALTSITRRRGRPTATAALHVICWSPQRALETASLNPNGAMPNQSEADRAPVLDNFAGYLISAGSWFEYTVVGRRRDELNQSDPEIVNSSSGHIVSIASG